MTIRFAALDVVDVNGLGRSGHSRCDEEKKELSGCAALTWQKCSHLTEGSKFDLASVERFYTPPDAQRSVVSSSASLILVHLKIITISRVEGWL